MVHFLFQLLINCLPPFLTWIYSFFTLSEAAMVDRSVAPAACDAKCLFGFEPRSIFNYAVGSLYPVAAQSRASNEPVAPLTFVDSRKGRG